jgi:hypothetical protein
MAIRWEDNYENDTTNKCMKLIVHIKAMYCQEWRASSRGNVKNLTFQQCRVNMGQYVCDRPNHIFNMQRYGEDLAMVTFLILIMKVITTLISLSLSRYQFNVRTQFKNL